MIFILRTSYINKQNNALNFIQTEENNVVIYSDRHDLRTSTFENLYKCYKIIFNVVDRDIRCFFFFFLS